MSKQRPEALAEFAESARQKPQNGKPGRKPLEADAHTIPVPEDNALKHDAATRVLQEGATGEDKGSEDAIGKLHDRIVESR